MDDSWLDDVSPLIPSERNLLIATSSPVFLGSVYLKSLLSSGTGALAAAAGVLQAEELNVETAETNTSEIDDDFSVSQYF